MDQTFNKIVNEICKEDGINQEFYSYNWVRKLSKDGAVHYIINNELDINNINAVQIADDKYATYEVLRSQDISVLEHHMIFNPSTREEYYRSQFIEDTEKLLEEKGKIVIKANNSYGGKDVFLVNEKEDVKKIIIKLFEENKDTLSSQPFYDIDYEYRTIFLNGEVIYMYKKEKPYKIENGKKIYTSWKHNLCQGGVPILVDKTENHYEEIVELAVRAGNAVGINFASIDIALTSDEKLYVIEINGSVCLNKFSELIPNGYEIAKNVYKKAIDYMFEGKK